MKKKWIARVAGQAVFLAADGSHHYGPQFTRQREAIVYLASREEAVALAAKVAAEWDSPDYRVRPTHPTWIS